LEKEDRNGAKGTKREQAREKKRQCTVKAKEAKETANGILETEEKR